MKNIILTLLLLCSFNVMKGQNQISKNLDYSSNYLDGLAQIEIVEDGFILSTAYYAFLENNIEYNGGLIVKIDKEGRTIWSKRINPPFSDQYLYTTPEHFLILNDKIIGTYKILTNTNPGVLIFSIDVNGENFKYKFISKYDKDIETSSIVGIDDHYYTVFKLLDIDSTWLVKLDTDLNIIGERMIKLNFPSINKAQHLNLNNDSTLLYSYSFYKENSVWYKIENYDLDFNLIKDFSGFPTYTSLPDVFTLPTGDKGYLLGWNKDMSHTLYDTFPYPSALYKLDSSFNIE